MAESLITVLGVTRKVIETRVRDLWKENDIPLTPIQYPSVLGLVDIDGQIINASPTQAPWLKLDIQWGSTEEATISDTCSLNRSVGVILLSIYVPANRGSLELDRLKGLARGIFSRYVGNGLRCRASSPGPDLPNAGWIVGIISTAFEFYENAS